MADLRLIAALAAAAVGCGKAGAEPPGAVSGLSPPASWQVLPDVAAAARTALGTVRIDGVEAWGEPARGCYAVWMSVRGSGGAQAIGNQILASLGGDASAVPADAAAPGSAAIPATAKLALHDIVMPTGETGVLAVRFERAPYRGRLRARIADGRVTSLACFANQREPLACDVACTAFLGSLP